MPSRRDRRGWGSFHYVVALVGVNSKTDQQRNPRNVYLNKGLMGEWLLFSIVAFISSIAHGCYYFQRKVPKEHRNQQKWPHQILGT